MKTLPPPTPEEIEQLRQLLHRYGAQILNFADDLKQLVAHRDAADSYLLGSLMVIISKGEKFMNMPDTQFLNKEIRDDNRERPSSGPKRQDCHVVPGKRERIRRQSGGGHPIFGFDDFGMTGGEGIDDDVPF